MLIAAAGEVDVQSSSELSQRDAALKMSASLTSHEEILLLGPVARQLSGKGEMI